MYVETLKLMAVELLPFANGRCRGCIPNCQRPQFIESAYLYQTTFGDILKSSNGSVDDCSFPVRDSRIINKT